MKILFWTDGFWPRSGGIETQALQFVEELQKRGHRCEVLAQKDWPSWKEDEIYKGISIKRFAFNTIIAKQDIAKIRLIKVYLERIIEGFQPDILHLNLPIGWGAFVFLLFGSLFQMPIVLTCHYPFTQDERSALLIQKFFSTVDQICCVSKWVLEEMEKLAHKTKNPLRLIYNGLSMPEIVYSLLPFSPPVLLLLGRLSTEKGFDTGIEAFSLLKQSGSNARLIIAGEGASRSSLQSLVDRLGLGGSVQFTGGLARDDVHSLINRATLVVMPSHVESFGLVALEAMQMQRPVIASAVGGLREIISDGKTGFLIPPRDAISLFQAIERLLKQPEKTVQMGIEGRKRAMDFTLDRNVGQYENLYEELVKL